MKDDYERLGRTTSGYTMESGHDEPRRTTTKMIVTVEDSSNTMRRRRTGRPHKLNALAKCVQRTDCRPVYRRLL